MPHRQLAPPILILWSVLVKATLTVTLDGTSLADCIGRSHRELLQSTSTDWETCEAVIEYDPLLDDPLELKSLSALYAATGGQYWTYGYHFATESTLSGVNTSSNETSLEALVQRFNKTAWLDSSVSYCQW